MRKTCNNIQSLAGEHWKEVENENYEEAIRIAAHHSDKRETRSPDEKKEKKNISLRVYHFTSENMRSSSASTSGGL